MPSEDTFICGDEAQVNFGNQSTLSLHDECSALLKWPLTEEQIANRTVTQATLRLFVLGQPVANAGASVFFVNPVLPRWTELGATWQSPRRGEVWDTDGARGADVDYNSSAMGYMSVDGATAGWVDIDLSVAMINDWIQNPANNKGMIVWSSTAQNNLRMTSSEWFNPAFRPQLVLEVE